MTRRLLVFVVVVAVVGIASVAYAVRDYDRYHEAHTAAPSVPSTDPSTIADGPRIVFRHTGVDDHYGQLAMVSLADPSGPRAFLDRTCDRVYATDDRASCLVIRRGVVTKYEALDLDADWSVVRTTDLPGIPSRTRLSPDGRLVATTSFVTGHSYMTTGFSTATEVRRFDGRSYGNLEDFTFVLDGRPVTRRDRNVWGVTFADDDRTFYATVSTGGTTYLVRGDLADRTLTALTENAECPSLSPDGKRVAFKVDLARGAAREWAVAVLDLATGTRTQIDGTRGLDDQVAWLDDDTILYGLPRDDDPGTTDVWAVDTRRAAAPRLLIEQAWSPAVIGTSGP